MPVKNGWDTFEQLTREHPLIPVIIATARPNQLFTAINAGVGALLEKPMDIPMLLRTFVYFQCPGTRRQPCGPLIQPPRTHTACG